MIVTHRLLDCNKMIVIHKLLDCNKMIESHKKNKTKQNKNSCNKQITQAKRKGVFKGSAYNPASIGTCSLSLCQ